MVVATDTAPLNPLSVIKIFSGDVEGAVTSFPFLSSINHAEQNTAASFIMG